MPTYTIFNEHAGMEYEVFMSISEYEQFMKDNPHCKRVWDSAPAVVGDHISGVGPKVDSGFTENMQRIAEAHPNSPMADRYGVNKTHARIKSEQIAKKHGLLNK